VAARAIEGVGLSSDASPPRPIMMNVVTAMMPKAFARVIFPPSSPAFHRPCGFTPDGQLLISWGEIVSIWDLKANKQKVAWSLRKHPALEKQEGQD